ncbi:MAG TPA: ribonuclease H-like domain-containing protein [Anaerolineales bacterium]|nr:ribonuclease H-like domain-containing protein [Anaerolineales bacterium]
MPSLSERLKSLGVKVGAQDLPAPRPKTSWPIEDVVPGRFQDTPGGSAFLVEAEYSPEYMHGYTQLGLQLQPNVIAAWAGDPGIASRDASSFAFLDTETSGLAGGTGTYAFMVGAGRYIDQGFQLVQFFMRDPLEEPALLLALEEFIAPCQTLVTFNGKSFDVPLLNTRYILQGWRSPFIDRSHIDLLHLSRRLWRDRLPSRTLSNLEVHILGVHRNEEEVPGWMIPQMYFEYLRDGDARPLKRVFYHNAMDVVSMAALLNHTTSLLEDPTNFPEIEALEMAAAARLYEELGQTTRAIQLYRQCLNSPIAGELFLDTSARLALIYKRQESYQEAIPLWEAAAQAGGVFACEELAKYYEHKTRDTSQADHWAQVALTQIKQSPYPAHLKKQWQADLEHRLERLKRKQQRAEQEE